MFVAVMQVRDVWVSVDQRPMEVPMGVADTLGRIVVLVVGVVFMLVRVLHREMPVLVLMARSEYERHAPEREDHGDELIGFDRLSQQRPGNEGTNEGRSGEDELSTSCAQVMRTADPQRDRRAVAHRPERQGAQRYPHRR